MLGDAIDAECDIATDGQVVRAMWTLRAAMAADIAARTAGLPDAVELTLGASVPAIVLAHRLYDDPGRAADLLARNDVRNPLFMPAGRPIEVLTDD